MVILVSYPLSAANKMYFSKNLPFNIKFSDKPHILLNYIR